MSKVRVKHHNDPSAVPSFGEGPDEHGGYLVDEKDLEIAHSHGFHVKHLHDESDEEEKTEPDTDPTVDETKTDLDTDDGDNGDNGSSDDEKTTSDDEEVDKTETKTTPVPRRRR